ncbi:MAG TPA: hypothetical protein VII06_07295 [Chloroflexota bacterium]
MSAGTRVIGILMLIGGLFSLVWGTALGTIGGASWLTGLVFSDTIQAWGSIALVSGLWSMLVGLVQIITAVGLFTSKRWAWVAALMISALALITPLVGLINGNLWSVFGLIIPAVTIVYLMREQDIQSALQRVFRLA